MAVGEIVFSKAGRDKGRPFLVVSEAGAEYIFLADGELRKVEKPKKKKVKHVAFTGYIIESFKERLENGNKIGNSEVRKLISGLTENVQVSN
ncbi:MAG: RNA-binding protein [Clostridiales bacterium]|nr:RNA-binding protein [Clostridiales bacterium]